jgi:hypothetical protein
MTHGRLHELDFEYTINGQTFNMLWYNVDLIYPQITRFLRSVAAPVTKIDRYYTGKHDGWRKDIERAIGVWKKKYHSLAHPITLFFIDDIYYLVGGTIAMHNMMVEERLKRDEVENENWYQLVAEGDPQHANNYQPEDVTKTAAAREAIAREDEHLAEHAAHADIDNEVVDFDLREDIHRAQLLTENMRYVQHYWEELTDVEEHMRLQNAVKHYLYIRKYGIDNDGDEVADFNPLEDCEFLL